MFSGYSSCERFEYYSHVDKREKKFISNYERLQTICFITFTVLFYVLDP